MYTNYSNVREIPNTTTYYGSSDDRFFLAPFLMGGLAGTALGYGIANNNQMTNQPYYPVPMYPIYYSSYPTYPTMSTYSNSNNYYY